MVHNAADAERLRASNEADALRLKELRTALVDHANRVPTGLAYSLEAGNAWLYGADRIVDAIAAADIKSIFYRSAHDEHQIITAAASLRAIAARVQATDLHA